MRKIFNGSKGSIALAARRGGTWLAVSALVVFSAGADAQRFDGRQERCQDLERQLVSDWQLSNNPSNAAARIDQQLAELDRTFRRAQAEAERRDCYEDMFIFGRSLRRTPTCIQLDGEVESTRRAMTNLRQQREALNSSANRRGRRDDLVAELARSGCGDNYAQEYESRRRRSSSIFSFWEDEDSGDDRSYGTPLPQQTLPFSSYRTMCVRTCDGYYFPISFATLSSRFREDESKCREQCAAPAELYTYRNPGEEVEQMVSLDGRPYSQMRNAFKHRKTLVKGCSCKPDEYSLQEITQSEQGAGRQAEAKTGPVSTPKTPPQSLDALTGGTPAAPPRR